MWLLSTEVDLSEIHGKPIKFLRKSFQWELCQLGLKMMTNVQIKGSCLIPLTHPQNLLAGSRMIIHATFHEKERMTQRMEPRVT